MSKRPFGTWWVSLAVLVLGVWAWAASTDKNEPRERAKPTGVIQAQDMADALQMIIATDRAMYARHVVQRLEEAKITGAGDRGLEQNTLPSPCQLLRLSTVHIQTKGAEFHYSLRSLTPLEPRNAPETDAEKTGLKFVSEHPDQNYYGRETLGGRRYFTAIYPDRAVVPSCVTCHNEHAASRRKDFKPGDVLGALVIRVALEF